MKTYFVSTVILLCSIRIFSQVPISLKDAEEALQKNNLLLMAEQFNITALQAAIIQAKIWEQPFISGELNAINPQANKFFDVGPQGQKSVALQQLIYLGGKKRNEVNFARSNVAISELQFEQLVRTLKFQLAQDFYSLYYDLRKTKTLDLQINKLDTLLEAYRVQSDRGNIALKEVIRLQTLVLSLKNERNSIQKALIKQQQEILLITGLAEPVDPIVDSDDVIKKFESPNISPAESSDIALEKNPDYLTVLKIAESQELFLRWQKSMATPDLITGLAYDQRGGAFINQTNLTLGIPLPLWNRNKGNIKIAEAQLLQSQVTLNYKRQELLNQVESAWMLWRQQKNQLASINNSVNQNLEVVYQGILNNFEKRNITLLEFTDFMESYNQTIIQINDIRKEWILSGLALNYIINSEVF